MSEMDWMYDSLTERFGENLGDRQKVVDALLISKAIVGPGPLCGTNSDSLLAVARFILDEWGKYSDAEDPEEKGEPVVLDNGVVTEADISLMKYGTHTFPEGSRWKNVNGHTLIFTNGEFWVVWSGYRARTGKRVLPFTRIKDDPRKEAPEVLFYSDLSRIRTEELDISPDDVWVTSTGDRVRIRGGEFFSLAADIYGYYVDASPFVPNALSFPMTKEN